MENLQETEFIPNRKFYVIQTQLAKTYVIRNRIYRKRNDTEIATQYEFKYKVHNCKFQHLGDSLLKIRVFN